MAKKKASLKSTQIKELQSIQVFGAREHNLKNIDVEIPKKKLVVITGVSGSGKSSLAFDTIYAEGQRRYVESLSSYARQFLGQMEKPKYDTIKGLSPTIAIEQKSASKNPRSTVGTITEVYDYLRVLFARVGTQYCHICNKEVGRGDAQSMVTQILEIPEGTKILLMSPIVDNRKGEYKDLLDKLRSEAFVRVRVDGVLRELSDVQSLAKNKKHNLEVIVDRLKIKNDTKFKKRLLDSVETALKHGNGQLIVHIEGREDIKMSEERTCCGYAFPELIPQLFSFNSPHGMCTSCNGIGSFVSIDESKIIPDPSLSICMGGVRPWDNYFDSRGRKKDMTWGLARINGLENDWGLDLEVPWNKIPKQLRERVLYGSDDPKYKINFEWEGENGAGNWSAFYEGLIPRLMRLYMKSKNDGKKTWVSKYTSVMPCSSCNGSRLKPEIRTIKIKNQSIGDITHLSIKECFDFFNKLNLKGSNKIIADELLKEIISRLGFLVNVGLNYLSLERSGPTLSGGEAQRIRLASQIGSELTGVLYILDEPSIGLHQRDNDKLIKTLCHLRDIGNTLLVVEHDQETMEASDWILDIGPGAGRLGGQVMAQGTPKQLAKNKDSITGKFLSGREKIEIPEFRRINEESYIEIIGANANNLKNVDCKIPLSLFTCISGVSGAGKSSLINQILFPALNKILHQSDMEVGEHKEIKGLEHIDKVINIDQKPIGKTPRSNPATYTKAFDLIRDLFASLPESKMLGYQKGRFSFNVKGGRCENCQGDGHITVEMHFLADVMIPCDVCKTKRFNDGTLAVKFKNHSIADILDLSVEQSIEVFQNQPKIRRILDTLMEVGLDYIKLGQAATTLSGGEAQRIKLARELAKRDTGKTLYILDEPTTGLHFYDIRKLLKVIQKLTDNGNTIVVIEHNLDVIKSADWVIDMGPEGGQGGGMIIAEGTPEKVSKIKASPTGLYLKRCLNA